MNALRTVILVGLAWSMWASLAGAQEAVDHKIPPGYKPEQGADEKGLWMEVDDYEKSIQQSALLVSDPDINNYVGAILCRVAAEYCADFRVYVIRNPGFNASMTPTGSMQIWTGLLLRARSSDEVAAVIGHEIAHYTRLHTLDRLRSMKKSMAAGTFLDIGLAIFAGVSVPVGQAAAILSVLSFNREQESEADFLGARLVANAAYDPHAAYQVWEGLIAEEASAAVKRREPGIFSKTHPDAADRATELKEWIDARYGPADAEPSSNNKHLKMLEDHYLLLMEDQLDTNRFGRTKELLERHSEMGINPSLVRFFYGEMFRQRGQDGDGQRATNAYLHSIEGGNAPPSTFKNLGYLYLKADKMSEAQAQFRRYLEADPEASDRAMIEFYLEEES